MKAGTKYNCEDCGRPGKVGDDLSLSGQQSPYKVRCRQCREDIKYGRRGEHDPVEPYDSKEK